VKTTGITETHAEDPQRIPKHSTWNRIQYAIYALVLAVPVSVWLTLIRDPLNQDETGSVWDISAGFSKIWPHQFISLAFPAYAYILWLFTKILGTSEAALRTPSFLAMLGAAVLLYLAARELFERDLAVIATLVFCVHPIVIVESVNVRPYAFAILATNAAILVMLRLRRSNSNGLAALFGLLAACIVYFYLLFAVILPALVLCFFVVKSKHLKPAFRQFAIALAVFVLAFLPVIPSLHYLLHTAGTHVYEVAPNAADLIWTLAPGILPFIAAGAILVALVLVAIKPKPQQESSKGDGNWRLIVCLSLAFIPLLTLYGLSVGTPLHLFVNRHRVIAIPGISLCWALLLSRYLTRPTRLLFCAALAAVIAFQYYVYPYAGRHFVTWKYALALAEKNASADNAPVLVCSDYIESDYLPMPVNSPTDSRLFSTLAYYKLTVPVVPLPQDLNDQAIRIASDFLQQAEQKHQRFLAIASPSSVKTLDWLTQRASPTYSVHNLGAPDGIEVLEFTDSPSQSSPQGAVHGSGK
jgi:4-amino-4-deoxy-L-arabinose transferase-like glycosyltransferase